MIKWIKSNFEKCIFLIVVFINIFIASRFDLDGLIKLSIYMTILNWHLGIVPFFKEYERVDKHGYQRMSCMMSCFYFYQAILLILGVFCGFHIWSYFLWLLFLLFLTFKEHKYAIKIIFKIFPY